MSRRARALPPRSREGTSRARSRPRFRARPRTRAARTAGPSCGELLEEPEIVLVEQADVVDAVFQHRDAFDAGAEGESRIAFGVVADGLEQRGVNHSAAEDLQPARVLADRTAFAAAALAADIDLGARL